MELPKNSKGEPIVLGCNYHTTWQKFKSMRFVLHSVNWDRGTAILITRRTKKTFSAKMDDLVFIDTENNRHKADRLMNYDEDSKYLKALLIQG